PRCQARRALPLSGTHHLAVRRRDRGVGVARVVDLLGPGHAVGNDPARDRIHLLVLAVEEGGRGTPAGGDPAISTRREATPASIPAIPRGNALDVGHLPTYGFGTRSLMWWGTAGMIAIEGTAFAFMIVIYFYLRTLGQTWPAAKAAPDLLWGTINLALILLSTIPF